MQIKIRKLSKCCSLRNRIETMQIRGRKYFSAEMNDIERKENDKDKITEDNKL